MPLERQCESPPLSAMTAWRSRRSRWPIDPMKISDAEAAGFAAWRKTSGLVISGLHWLLVTPAGLSLVPIPTRVRRRTLEVMTAWSDSARELGGSVPGARLAEAARRSRKAKPMRSRLAPAAGCLGAGGADCGPRRRHLLHRAVVQRETSLVNTDRRSGGLVRAIDSSESQDHDRLQRRRPNRSANPSRTLIDRWLPTGLIAHVQVNDPNRRGPGQGEMKFAPILAALKRHNYSGTIAVEPFDYVPDGAGVAAFSVGYLRGLREALSL